MRVVAALLLLVTVPAAAQGQGPGAPALRLLAMKDGEVTLVPRVKVGERFQVLVTVTHPPDMVVGMPASFERGVFEVLERRELPAATPGERTFELTVVAWQPGRQTLPPVPITYVPRGQGELKQIATGELEVDVLALVPAHEAEDLDLRPIAPPVPVYEEDWTLIIVAGVAAFALVAAAVAFLALRGVRRRRQRARAAEPILDLRPPDEIALEKLRALASSPLLDAADRRPFYFALSEVVREYLGRRYGFAALDMTTSELLAALHGAPDDVRDDVERWLGDCDLVKFARVPATRADAISAVDEAIALVARSKPAPPATAPPAEPEAEAQRAG